MLVAQIEPQALKELLDRGVSVLLIDVRQAEEYALVHLDNSVLIPLDQLQQRLAEVGQLFAGNYQERIVYCRSGGRSASAIEWLEKRGLTGFKNLRGGINAFAREADLSLQPY